MVLKDLLWCWYKHKLNRVTYMSPRGALKCWEVFPIIILCTTAITSYISYFSLWYWHTRTDVRYKFWPPLQETMTYKKIKVCKLGPTKSYLEYDPENYKAADEILRRMRCEERRRKKCSKT